MTNGAADKIETAMKEALEVIELSQRRITELVNQRAALDAVLRQFLQGWDAEDEAELVAAAKNARALLPPAAPAPEEP